jgi:hypothetical protein
MQSTPFRIVFVGRTMLRRTSGPDGAAKKTLTFIFAASDMRWSRATTALIGAGVKLTSSAGTGTYFASSKSKPGLPMTSSRPKLRLITQSGTTCPLSRANIYAISPHRASGASTLSAYTMRSDKPAGPNSSYSRMLSACRKMRVSASIVKGFSVCLS